MHLYEESLSLQEPRAREEGWILAAGTSNLFFGDTLYASDAVCQAGPAGPSPPAATAVCTAFIACARRTSSGQSYATTPTARLPHGSFTTTPLHSTKVGQDDTAINSSVVVSHPRFLLRELETHVQQACGANQRTVCPTHQHSEMGETSPVSPSQATSPILTDLYSSVPRRLPREAVQTAHKQVALYCCTRARPSNPFIDLLL